MIARLEITAAIIRVWRGDAAHGAPFAEAVYVLGDEGVAILKGYRASAHTRDVRRAIAAALAQAGFREVMWYRWRDGRRRVVRFPLRPVVAG